MFSAGFAIWATATASAARFVVDFLSVNPDDPERAASLRSHLLHPGAATPVQPDVSRQRADAPVPTSIRIGENGTVLVEVTARVISYRRTCSHPAPDRGKDPSDRPAPADPITAPVAAADPPRLPVAEVGPAGLPPGPAETSWTADAARWVSVVVPLRRGPHGAFRVDLTGLSQHDAPTDEE